MPHLVMLFLGRLLIFTDDWMILRTKGIGSRNQHPATLQQQRISVVNKYKTGKM
jgi:hypothetical protein